ncbi:MAG: serine/threonine protein kinase, partial [Gammaproteobacteria bacterium]|nr:serine/threonine protein kinase [Gammaproteobacteria bacterium]
MTGDYGRIRALFDLASDLPEEERSSFLQRECVNDPNMRLRVERLLAADGERIDIIGHDIRRSIDGDIDERFGEYRLIKCVGHGGMGDVWLAEQDPPLQRLVAIKVIKPGLDTRQVIARFELERQTLAKLGHPGIAQVFDAGATASGRPYFVMEFVDGLSIADYCDQHCLNIRERLQLFRTVCDAVSHAHRKAIIHRDLKPANILVVEENGRPFPKIIDFGIAKATSEHTRNVTALTMVGHAAGTPAYMSPEQHNPGGGDAVDTRTDVFGLGVVLYELLTGQLPYTAEATADSYRGSSSERFIRPSTAIARTKDRASLAAARRTDISKLASSLSGDLDCILRKALEFEMDRRYDSIDSFSRDIDNHLCARPIAARPPSWTYVAMRFMRRHRLAVAASALLLVSVAIGLG